MPSRSSSLAVPDAHTKPRLMQTLTVTADCEVATEGTDIGFPSHSDAHVRQSGPSDLSDLSGVSGETEAFHRQDTGEFLGFKMYVDGRELEI